MVIECVNYAYALALNEGAGRRNLSIISTIVT
jgi:hypothetical protein